MNDFSTISALNGSPIPTEQTACEAANARERTVSAALQLALSRNRMEYDDENHLVHVPISEVLADADAILNWMNKAAQ